MKTKELKQEIQKMLQEKKGITIYAIIRKQDEEIIRSINIADEQDIADNTAQELLDGFVETINNKFSGYEDDDEIIKLSAADERKNGLYCYDLEELPKEMDALMEVSNPKTDIETFNFQIDSLESISAFVVVVGNAEENIVMYKQQYPISLLKRDRYMLTPIPHQNRLKKFNQDILRVDFNYQFFLWKDVIYISDIDKMEKICSFHNIIVNEAKKSIQAIEQMDILDNVEVLSDELDNITFARKLTRVYKDSKVIGKVENAKIVAFSQQHSYFQKNPLKLNENKDKFLLDTKKSKDTFIKLLNDDLLTSELTSNDYEALAKNNA
ncbi:anti-phage protein KwaB [Mediterraneibacter sp. HCN-7094]